MTGDAGRGVLHPPSKLHFNEQEARALLRPIVAALRALEARAERYGHVTALSEADTAAVAAAHAAIKTARGEVERLAEAGHGGVAR